MFGKKESGQKTKNEKDEINSMKNEAGDGAVNPETKRAGTAGGTASAVGSPRPKKKSKKKKRIIIALVAVAAVAVAIKMFAGGSAPIMPTPTGTASQMDIQQVITIKGRVEGNDRAEVTSAQDREIASISVKEGDMVKKGQLLATLKKKDNIADKNQKYDIQVAQNNLESAKYDYETSKKLYDAGAISQQDFLRTQTAYENAKTSLASAKTDKTTKDDREITSPIDGIVTRVNAKVGFTANQMQSGTALFVIEDLASLKMQVKASEYDISKIKVGQSVIISAEVLGNEKAEGVVSHIAPTGELKDSSGKEMVIPVKIDIKNAGSNLIAGVTAKADILVAERKGVVGVSLDSLLIDPVTGDTCLFTVSKDNVISKQVITAGLEGDFYVEITSDNIKDGDTIVLNPTSDMTDGQTIVLMPTADGQSEDPANPAAE